MTKNQAIREIATLSSGTIANIIGSTKYERIDAASCGWILDAANKPDDAFERCNSWSDVLRTLFT